MLPFFMDVEELVAIGAKEKEKMERKKQFLSGKRKKKERNTEMNVCYRRVKGPEKCDLKREKAEVQTS